MKISKKRLERLNFSKDLLLLSRRIAKIFDIDTGRCN
jgi:hypothetical protein